MENVIETYELPYDPEVHVVVMDEQPVQLFNEVRKPIQWHFTLENARTKLESLYPKIKF